MMNSINTNFQAAADYLMNSQKNTKAEDELLDLLPPDFSPGKYDVICQRGKECFDHGKRRFAVSVVFYPKRKTMKYSSPFTLVGNRRFRMCIDSHLEKYIEVKSRQQKSNIVSNIVHNITKAASKSGGGFVRKVRTGTHRSKMSCTVKNGI